MTDFNTHIRNLCPEIRMNIFADCLLHLGERHETSSPALLAALRPDSQLYEEALETYYKINCFKLDPENPQPFLSLKNDRVLQLRKLLIYAYNFSHRPFIVHPKIATAQNVEYPKIMAHIPDYIWLQHVAAVVASTKQFPRLKTLVLDLGTSPLTAHGLLGVNPSSGIDRSARATVDLVEKEMGIKLKEVLEGHQMIIRTHRTFIWEAGQKKVII